MKPRLCVYLSDHVDHQLALAAKRPGASKSAITEAALAAFLTPGGEKHEAAFIRRLDRMSRQLGRLDRDQVIISETLALFVRYYLTITPPLPGADQEAAKALGKERFEYFVSQIGRRLAGGKTLVRDVLEDLEPAESDLLTSGEIESVNGEAGMERPHG